MQNNESSSVTQTPLEKVRIDDLLEHMLPKGFSTALDVGVRFGHLAKLLTPYFDCVTALDLEMPNINHDKVVNAQGDVTHLNFPDNHFDVVYCTEVLEHIPSIILKQACAELSRVARHYLIIGVPYKQDIRSGRTTCIDCGKKNPPWGHVNVFDEHKLVQLFPSLHIKEMTFVGEGKQATNLLSVWLMDLANNPYGTYNQLEPCIYCGAKLKQPYERNLLQKILTKLAFYLTETQITFLKSSPNWIHIMFKKY